MKKKRISKNPKLSYSIGLDLGGTKLATALVDSRGKIIEYNKFPLEINKAASPSSSKKKVLGFMLTACLDYKLRFPEETSGKKFLGIGLASAGPLNVADRVLIDPSNFPGWKKFKIVNELQTSLKKSGWAPQFYFQNDAIAAAYAEKWMGAAKKSKSFVVITVGTGIGTGVILNGLPCQTNGMGSEWGHLLIDIKGLQKNKSSIVKHTVEGIASGTALLRIAKENGFTGNSVEELVAEHSRTKQFQFIFDDMAWALASLCYSLSLGFHFDQILFSGGLIKIKKLYFEQTKKLYKQMICEKNPAFLAPIHIAKAGNKAGVLGAAGLPHLLQN